MKWKRSSQRFVYLCAAVLLILTFAVPAPAQADASVLRDSSVEVFEVAFEEISCDLYLTGTAEIRYFLQFVYDSKGGQHRQVRVMYKYDLQSADGTPYSGTAVSHARINGRLPEFNSAVNYTSTSHINLTTPGEGQRFSARSKHHWTINSNGEMKTSSYENIWSCK